MFEQLDKKVIEGIAKRDPKYEDRSLIKVSIALHFNDLAHILF